MSKPEEMAETLQEFSLVYQRDIVFCDPGEDVVLSCHLQPAISAVSMEIMWKYRADLICHYKNGQVTVSSGYEDKVNLSLHDLHNGNVSLTLKDVRASHGGLYICEVIYKWQAKKEYIFLHVRSRNFALEASPLISAYTGEDVNLPVRLRPETSAVSMKIKWLKGPLLIYQYNYGQGTANSAYENRVSLSTQELERGNLSLTLRNVQLPDSGHYKCITSHDESVMTAVVCLSVRDLKSDSTNMRSRYLENVLRELQNDLPTKFEESLTLLQEALDHGDKEKKRKKKKETDDGTFRRSSSMEGIPPLMENENPLERYRFAVERHNRYFFSLYDPIARLTRSVEEIPLHRRDEDSLERFSMAVQRHLFHTPLTVHGPTLRRIGSMEGIPPLMSDWSSLESDEESDSDTHAPDMQVISGQRTSVSSPVAATQPHDNPETTMQQAQERRQESIATEQGIFAMHSEVPLRETTSQSVTSEGVYGQINPGVTTQESRHERIALEECLSSVRLQIQELRRLSTALSSRIEAYRTQTRESVATGTSQLVTASSSAARTQTQERAGAQTPQIVTLTSAAARAQTRERAGARTSQLVTTSAAASPQTQESVGTSQLVTASSSAVTRTQTQERVGTRPSRLVIPSVAVRAQTRERAGARISQLVTTSQTQERVGTSQLVTASSSAVTRTQTQERVGAQTSRLVTPSIAAREQTRERAGARTQSAQRRQEPKEETCNIL